MSNTVLIVEDESIVAQDLQLILEDLGYNVPAIADSGELAIEKAAEIQPNLILMDIRLIGEMDGIAAAQIISEQFDIPVVYMTAHSDEATLARAKLTVPFGYVIKPFEEREIRTTIEIALYKHEMEKKLKENAHWLATILKSIGDGVIATDRMGRITFLNPVAEMLTGWSFDEAVGKDSTKIFKIIHEISRQTVNNPIMEVLKTNKIATLPEQTLLVAKDGREIPIEDSVAPITHHKGTALLKDNKGNIAGTVLVFRDVTQQRLAAKKLYRQAFYDILTNLPNRAWFKERLTDAVERVKRNPDYLFAVMFLDLDRFKIINDSMGHSAGDRLLVEVASRLSQSVRSIDTVTRMGGDEFAILLENLQNPGEAYKIARRIQQQLSEPIAIDEQEVFTNASIGIVLSSMGSERVEELIRDADIAMYRAKAKGKGRYEVFDLAMREQVVAASLLENDLRRAIDRNELSVYYQPIVCLASQKTLGFEALIRWHHPQQGFIPPDNFIPIAEETGLIIAIDEWVLQNACHQLMAWQKQHPNLLPLTVSVNLSSKQFAQPNIVEKIERVLIETDLDAQSLILEITESALIENPQSAAETLAQLKALGVGLSLDDFGTGYSSLSYLHRFPVNTIKIDRSFINRIDTEQDGLEIVRTIVMLGKTLEMNVVAEGLETTEQLALLQQLQCRCGQGYFFSKPLPASQIVVR
ncbi:MAG: EAL domain-containing protein [Hydrococcus sp. Prado102]|jgi:diguanylate cyclase (GGDEF)-like protein/PAS domain S-box-containing protein|nr:EAL domain-containing protein [Hydrococcus sp. Prado102]